jgi:hypothetical protein
MATNQLVKKKIGRFTFWLAPPYADSPLQNALTDGFHSLATVYTLNKVPASKSADVYKFSCDNGKFYFKQYHYRSLWDFIKHTFRPSRAMRTINAAAMLAANGFLAPEIITMGYRCKGIFRIENFLLTREVENAQPLYVFFEKRYDHQNSCPAEKREFIKALGHLIGRLHAKNISHGDLRLGNVLVRKNDSGWEFFLLDNERTVQYARLPRRLRLKNLVQCNMHQTPALTHTDRLRFFNAYLAENPALTPAAKTWLKKIHQKTLYRHSKRAR